MRREKIKSHMTHETKIKKKSSLLIVTLLFALCFFSCNLFNPDNNTEILIPAGMGVVRLSVMDANVRTVMPGIPIDDVERYFLEFTNIYNPGHSQEINRDNDNLETPVFLEPGIYNLFITAYLDVTDNLPVAEGGISGFTIAAGKREEYTVLLKPIMNQGTGTFNWDITFADNLDLSFAEMRIEPLAGSSGATTTNLLIGPSPYIGHSSSVTLASGLYSLFFNLTNGISPDDVSITWREVLHIYNNLESSFSYEFTEDHFNNPGFTVIIMPNNGDMYTSRNYPLNGLVVDLGEPVNIPVGYTFGGWYTDNVTFINQYNFAAPVSTDIILYARWVPITYNIIYEANGGSGTMAQGIFTYNRPEALGFNTFTRTGWSFTGWNTEADGSGTAYADRQQVERLRDTAGSITLYALWEINKYTVTFNLMNGTGDVPPAQTVNFGSVITLPDSDEFGRIGYAFTGWNTVSNVLGNPFGQGSNYTVTGNITMYAQWTAVPTEPGQPFNIRISPMANSGLELTGLTAPIVIYRYGGSSSATINIENAADYDEITWRINNNYFFGETLTLSADNSDINQIGKKFVTLIVEKDSRIYTHVFEFEVRITP